MTYIVVEGDSLYSIAQKFNINLDDLIAANPQIKDIDLIYPDQVINVPINNENPNPIEPEPGCGHCIDLPAKTMLDKICMPEMYPTIMVEKKDCEIGRMLKDLLAGKESKMTSFYTCLYYRVIFLNTPYHEMSSFLNAASYLELKHMHGLMEFIKLLGCDPKCENAKMIPWCGNCVNYHLCNVCNFLMDAIQNKEMSAKRYQKYAQKVTDSCVSNWLTRIAMDEEHMAHLFKMYYQKYCKPMG